MEWVFATVHVLLTDVTQGLSAIVCHKVSMKCIKKPYDALQVFPQDELKVLEKHYHTITAHH